MQFNLVDQEFNEGNAFRWAIWPFNQRVPTRVSNGTGHCNFSGQWNRSYSLLFHCPGTNGQQDKLKIKQRDRTVLGGTAKIRDGTGWDSQNPRQDTEQNRTEQKRTF